MEAQFLNVMPAENLRGMFGLLQDAATTGDGALKQEQWSSVIRRIKIPPGEASYGLPSPPTPAMLDLLPAGIGDKSYPTNLSSFSWTQFFSEKRGFQWLEEARQQWSAAYDFVFIDSRTGLTDSGGICTILMPDILVLVFTANNQSFEGGIEIVKAAQRARRDYGQDRGQLTIVPLLSRWSGDEEIEIAETWLTRFDRELPALIASWFPKKFKPRQFLERLRVPHVARFSFGEPLPVLTHSITDPALPGLAFEILARLLSSQISIAGRIIDPNYEPTETLSGPSIEMEAQLLRLVQEPAALERELARIATASGNDSDELVTALISAASLFMRLGRFAEAEPLLRRALDILGGSGRGETSQTAFVLRNLGLVLRQNGRLFDAETFFRRALSLHEAHLGHMHPEVATDLLNLASTLQDIDQVEVAEPLVRRALTIHEASLGPDHPAVATDLLALSSLLRATARSAEALPLIRRALAIYEANYGINHVEVANALSVLANNLWETGAKSEAEQSLRRAIAIDEQNFGPDHPRVSSGLTRLATWLQPTRSSSESQHPLRRAEFLPPIGFWAYARIDEANSEGRLRKLRELVMRELRVQFGSREVRIFQDINLIEFEDRWEGKIINAIDQSSFFIPIVTPGFLQSEWCLRELDIFRRRENSLKRDDLVFPIYYVDVGESAEASYSDASSWNYLRVRQWADFRSARHLGLDSTRIRVLVATFAEAIRSALARPPRRTS